MLTRVLVLQWVLVIVTAGACALVAGKTAALSALLGGVSCAVPNAWFVWRIQSSAHRPGGARATDFFMGEAVKVVLTLMLMLLAAKLYAALVWPAFIVGLVVALKSYLFGLFLKKPLES